jgi:hypothetical protein
MTRACLRHPVLRPTASLTDNRQLNLLTTLILEDLSVERGARARAGLAGLPHQVDDFLSD